MKDGEEGEGRGRSCGPETSGRPERSQITIVNLQSNKRRENYGKGRSTRAGTRRAGEVARSLEFQRRAVDSRPIEIKAVKRNYRIESYSKILKWYRMVLGSSRLRKNSPFWAGTHPSGPFGSPRDKEIEENFRMRVMAQSLVGIGARGRSAGLEKERIFSGFCGGGERLSWGCSLKPLFFE